MMLPSLRFTLPTVLLLVLAPPQLRAQAGMKGMKMPPAAGAPADTVKPRPRTPVRKTKTGQPKPSKVLPSKKPLTPRVTAADTAHHAEPAPPMPAMQMATPADTGRRPSDTTAAHAMHDMPPARSADTSMKDMKGMADTGSTAGMRGDDMAGMQMRTPDPLGVSMDRMGSGTTWVPDAAPIPSAHFAAPGSWDVTGHGFAFLQYDRQGGPRGDSQLGSLNWIMLMASHSLAGGRIQARTMLSLDALTVTPRGYPLLLQSGEAYDGAPLHDRQHPHDVFMELSALYEVPITRTLGLMLYAAPSGEPALGPVAFMHRPSAMDNPTAPITHHWADATHISFGVLSAGLFTNTFKLEGSIFNGREPDQQRFGFDPIRLDSYSGRATYNPSGEWSFTGGYGWLKSPEALNPGESIHRVTASALHGTTLGTEGQWSSSVVYGANSSSTRQGQSHSILLETEAMLNARHTVFGRAEVVQKSAEELSLDGTAGFAADRSFTVGELSLGYIRDVARFGAGTLGVGAMGTLNVVPSALEPAYGSRTPLGGLIFLRVRPFRTRMSMRGPADASRAKAHAH